MNLNTYTPPARQLPERADEPVASNQAWRCHGLRPRSFAAGKRFFERWNGRYFALYVLEAGAAAVNYEI